ncbi:hypothetical protein QN399_02730 [Pseudomonas sp. 10C3]|uniref:hypothetical protein n=1 Tax=Pseudomonas sp. 10C3 TaxID=3118753 RepID=UPI002E80F81C|nr:hypothetical protein [Pseudomonas sp. 10C3]MEE3505188.1 hypothetical protein [Pseudomonas sp. 10C3]
MEKLMVLLLAGALLAGCGLKTRSDRAMDDFNAKQRDESLIRASGVRVDINEYDQSHFAQTHNVRGFLADTKAKQAKALDDKRSKFDQDFPKLLKITEGCVLGNYHLSERELALVAKQCFPDDFNRGLTPYAWRDEVIKKSVEDLSPHFAKVREQMKAEARQRALEDRQQAAQDKRDREVEAKRAYDNSLRSLVE